VQDVLGSTRRSRVIDVVGSGLSIFCPYRRVWKAPEIGPYQYIHSKVFIFDDAFCTIGSMNFNLRSTTHDSELSIGFYEPGNRDNGIAKRLRVGLWTRHLGLSQGDLGLLDDPQKGIALWNGVDRAPSFNWPDLAIGSKAFNNIILDKLKHDHWASLHPAPLTLPDGRQVIPNVMRYDPAADETLVQRAGSSVVGDQWVKLPKDFTGNLGRFIDAFIDPEIPGMPPEQLPRQ